MSNTGTTLSMKALLLFTKKMPGKGMKLISTFSFSLQAGSGIIQKRAQSSHQLSSAISAAAAAALINAFTLWAVLADVLFHKILEPDQLSHFLIRK